MLKNKKKMSTLKLHTVYWLIGINVILICNATYRGFQTYSNIFGEKLIGREVSAVVFTAAETSPAESLSVEEYVMKEVRKAGLSTIEVSCLIKNESGWNPYALNKNSDGSFDVGLWQMNDVHNKREIAFDYKKSTKWAIEKRLHDGNWSAWYGFNKCK